jgi:uncharacterized protein YjbI with pentapeptide repeats
MEEKRSWWQKVRKPLGVFGIIVLCILIFALLAVIIIVYVFNANVPGLRGKTLWDWLQLLIIPAALALGGYIFNITISRNDQRNTQDNQQEVALQSYLDRMSELLLEKKLRVSQPDDEVRNVARARTLTTLRKLNIERKTVLIRFIYESHLFDIVSLDDADLSGINLRNIPLKNFEIHYATLTHAFLENFNIENSNFNDSNFSYTTFNDIKVISSELQNVNLSHTKIFNMEFDRCSLIGADLSYAMLSNVILKDTDLRNTNLTNVRLINVDLTGTNVTPEQLVQISSLEGATMPDGSIHL